jgi:hypothetical protein
MGTSPSGLPTELFPIQVKGDIQRLNPMGDPTVSKYYTKALEQGRWAETSLGAAMNSLMTRKNDLQEKVTSYLSLQKVAQDGELPDASRPAKLAADVIDAVSKINGYMQQITALVNAIKQDIVMLSEMETNMLNAITSSMNVLAMLQQDICNLGLPALPSLLTLLGLLGLNNFFHFSGWKFFPLSGINLSTTAFSFNFAFSQCMSTTQNVDVFSSYPLMANDPYIPPLGGVSANAVSSSSSGSTSTTPALSNTTTPVYSSNVLTGSLPSPSTIISNYQLPAATYQANIVSVVPALQNLVVPATTTNYNVATPTAAQQSSLQQLLFRFVTLDEIVASDYDPNTTACWLFYLQICRTGRGGQWLANFQAAFTEYITPSITYLADNPVPWNSYNGVLSDEPTAIPLIAILQADASNNIHWKLSYLEAALLGYDRSTNYDSGADTVYLATYTGSNLDYVATTFATTTTTMLLGVGTATYESSITYPSNLAGVVAQAIAVGTANIANTPTYQTTNPAFLYTYNQYALPTVVDRYTQYWRQFAANFNTFLAAPAYVTQFVATYAAALSSAVDPLGSTTIYTQITQDADSRSRTWTPGTPLLPIPQAPVTSLGISTAPSVEASGWIGGTFDAQAFLSRPDIQSQPLNVQMAMLRVNQGYSSLQTYQATVSSTVAAAIETANAIINTVTLLGASAATAAPLSISTPNTSLTLNFALPTFDTGDFFQSPNTLTIGTAGSYSIAGMVTWSDTLTATRTVNLVINGTNVISNSVLATTEGPTTQPFTVSYTASVGDTLQMIVMNDTNYPLIIETAQIYCVQA